LLVKKYRGFIDKDSNQPAAEGTFMFEPRIVIGGCSQAVLHGLLGILVITEHAVRDQRERDGNAKTKYPTLRDSLANCLWFHLHSSIATPK
jgi:hypothetical protein